MNGVWAHIAFIAVIAVCNSFLERDIGGAMLAGFVACSLFGGTDAPAIAWHGLVEAMKERSPSPPSPSSS